MGAPPNIKTGLNTFWPLSFAKSRFNELIAVNGLDRGLRWNGISTSADALGIDAPPTAPAAAAGGAGGATEGPYLLGYRYVDTTLPVPVTSALSPTVLVQAANGNGFAWSGLVASTQTPRVGTIELWRSTSGQATTVYLVGTIANGVSSYSDFVSDATLQANAAADFSKAMLMLEPNGALNARRQVPPPDFKPYVAFFQDRMFLAGYVAYSVGTVATAGSATITGTATAWPANFVGRYLWIAGETKPLLITARASATSLTVSPAAGNTASGLSYFIGPAQEERNNVYYSEPDEPESMSLTNAVAIQENTGDDDEVTGLMPCGSYLYVLKTRHIYRLTFVAQPAIDSNISQVSKRGCVNNRCWVTFEDDAFVMDQQGIYRFDGNSVEPLSEPIQDLFREGTIDWSLAKWFFAAADLGQQVVRFHVSLVGDAPAATRPRHWLEWNTRTKTWQTGSAVVELGGACLVNIAGRTRLVAGGEVDTTYLFGEGVIDHVASILTGTAQAGGASTLTAASSATLTAAMVGAPLGILSGAGKGQIRKITAFDNTTKILTVDAAWTTQPASDSVYAIGAIKWNMKTGRLRYPPSDEQNTRQVRLEFEPTAGTATLDIRIYPGVSGSPINNALSSNRGASISVTAADPDAVLDMSLNRSLAAASPGFDLFPFSGRLDDWSQAARHVRVELRGFQIGDAIRLYKLDITGAQQQ